MIEKLAFATHREILKMENSRMVTKCLHPFDKDAKTAKLLNNP